MNTLTKLSAEARTKNSGDPAGKALTYAALMVQALSIEMLQNLPAEETEKLATEKEEAVRVHNLIRDSLTPLEALEALQLKPGETMTVTRSVCLSYIIEALKPRPKLPPHARNRR